MAENNKLPQKEDKEGYLYIQWQSGSSKQWGKNGIEEKDLLQICLNRFKGKQKQRSTREIAILVQKIEEAIFWSEKI